ncbi:hypothetical protein L6452_31139 [Arctium lappa]|uniref:Uncharacterized protein n=1 Tax=Arctium lappa TaxID=4217 RepID=A0ACB8ZJZ9_ARCLA|nr:hypothetical protein L6452_31139 [Arctium lappa]
MATSLSTVVCGALDIWFSLMEASGNYDDFYEGIRHKLQAYPLSKLLLLLNPQKDFAEFFVPPPSIVDDFGLAMVIVVVVVDIV